LLLLLLLSAGVAGVPTGSKGRLPQDLLLLLLCGDQAALGTQL
jgi:hypothetical protein